MRARRNGYAPRMTDIAVTPMEPGWYGVQVTEGHGTTSHRVKLPEDFALDAGVAGAAPETIVKESFNFLLEKEPATAISREFELAEIGRTFDDYYDQLRDRVAAA
jgi:hypothetical protein